MHQPITPNHQNPHSYAKVARAWACRDAVRTRCECDEAYSGRHLSQLDFFGTFCIKTKSTERKEHHYAEDTTLYFYHPDHLGSSSWITYTDGKAIEHLHYLPYGETQVDQRATSYAARYTFSAKEKDPETGYSYFGARYYSSDLSIWLSVDPMADKYPSMSPYVYCADNPIKLVDPDGKDYEIVIDEEHNTMTVKATYYTSKENADKLQKGLDAWNAESGKYTYTTGEGNDQKTYTVNFELTKVVCATDNQVQKKSPQQRGTFNIFSVPNDFKEQHPGDRGGRFGVNAQVDPSAPDRTTIHEIGHTLGIGEGTSGVMISGGDDNTIYEEHIQSIFNYAGITSYSEENCNISTGEDVNVKKYNMIGTFNCK